MCRLRFNKFLSVLLAVLILCSVVFSTNAFAEVSVSSDFVKKETTLDENRIYPYHPNETYYEITGFSETANVENITKLMLEDGETDKIGNEAFKNNPYIEEIFLDNKDFTNNNGGSYIPRSGIRSIGESAFENCTALKKVSLYYTTKLHSISKINIVEICNSAFKGCTSLEEFEVPASVTYIDSKAFADCTSLKKVAIYELTTEIADDAFENCDNLTIYGKSNSPAHKYAIEKNIPFVAIDYMSLMSISDIVMELCNNILYMDVMLKNYTIENNYAQLIGAVIFPVNFQDYHFQDYWSDELSKVYSETKEVFENPFITEDELYTAQNIAMEAIYKAELIEEIGRLIEPTRINSSWISAPPYYHHEGPCAYCLKVMEIFASYNSSPYFYSQLSNESYAQYSNMKEQITKRLEQGTLSTHDTYLLLNFAKSTIDSLITVEEENLKKSIDILNNQLDLSLYTNESVNEVKKYISQAEELIGKGYYYSNWFTSLQYDLDEAVSQLRLISFNELESKWDEYSTAYYQLEQYKYTLDSLSNFSNVLSNTYAYVIYPYYNLRDWWFSSYPSYVFPYQTICEAHLEMNNDMMVAELQKLTEAYNSLELKPLGDIDQDGRKGVSDVIYTLKGIVDPTYLYGEESQYFADMNSDGKVTVLDAILLQRDILEMA